MAINQQKLMGRTTTVQSATVAPQQQLVASPADNAILKDISKSLTNIISLLSQQNVQTKRDSDETRRSQERTRRQGIELGLEKSFATVKNVAQAVVAPVKSILDQIIQFFVTIFLGRALILLLNWFADENNRSKVRSIMRFLSDWWPSLVAGYILFGTGFGRVVRKVASIAVGATARLAVIAARLVKAIATGKGLKGAAAAFSGGGKLGGLKGFALRGGLAAAATVGTGIAINRMMGGGGGETPQLDVPEVPAVPALGASTGGLANLKDLFTNSTSGLSSKFNPFTSFFSSGGLASLMQGMSGVVSGPKGIDKVPAMLTDGEFVMSRGAVQKFGVGTLESMNAAGGGTNQPKIIRGIPHAAGGGYIGSDGMMGGVGELREKYDSKHGVGAYDKESARRKTEYNKIESPREAIVRLRSYEGPAKSTQSQQPAKSAPKTTKTPVTSLNPQIKQINIKAPTITSYKDPKREAEAQARKKARAEYNSILNNMDHPDYDKAWNDPKFLDKLKMKYSEQAPPKSSITPSSTQEPKPTSAKSAYVPYVSRFSGSRDAAFNKAKGIDSGFGMNPYNPMNWFNPGGTFGGPRMQARTDYAASKGKYYSSSDKKTYGNYNDAVAAKKSRMTSLASQQRLDKLSKQGAGYYSQGKRYDAEKIAKQKEYDKRGGIFGQIGRGLTSMFGTYKDIDKNRAADKASDARVKQSGAASIGRYYSSSDGKYYANFAAANKARIARQKPKGKTITPTPKPSPKIVSSKPKGGGGSSGSKGGGGKPSVPRFSASSGSNRKARNTYGIK